MKLQKCRRVAAFVMAFIMTFGIFIYNGKTTAKAGEEDINAGDTFQFGVNKKNGDAPIDWVITEINGDIVTVLSVNILERMVYSTTDTRPWITSDYRIYLNGDFYNDSFPDDKKAFIQLYGAADCQPDDKIIVPSTSEIAKWLGINTEWPYCLDPNPTTVAVFQNNGAAGIWYTRTISNWNSVHFIMANGGLDIDGQYLQYVSNCGPRPVMKLHISFFDGVTVTPPTPPPDSVESVAVNPTSAIVTKGETKQFTATLKVIGDPGIEVDWSITGTTNANTFISPDGLLTVAADEAAETLTVTATSQFDGTKYGIASVKVVDIYIPKDGLIPDDRRADWIPGVTVGVPGGIPENRTMFVNVLTTENSAYKCYADGVTNNTAAINAAISACPANQYVYLPTGVYSINGRINLKNNTTVVGDGQGKTVLKPAVGFSGSQVFSTGGGDWPMPKATMQITSGATKDSTTVTLNDTSRVNVGKYIRIAPNEQPAYVKPLNGMDTITDPGNANFAYNHTLSFMFMVVSKTADSVTFMPPLPMDISGMDPRLAPLSTTLWEGIGIESLTIDLDNTSAYGVYMEQAWGCWVKNVEIANSVGRQMWFLTTGASEVSGCFTHGTKGGGPNHEGIDFYADCCWNLIENNIVMNGGFPGIILGDWKGGCQGNVIAYNYCGECDAGGDVAGSDISFTHGPHNSFNLVEGNIVNCIQADGYFGSASHNTIFRNWTKGDVGNPKAVLGLKAIDLCHFNTYYNVIGNVLGTPGFTGLYSVSPGYTYADRTLYRLGFPNMGNPGSSGVLEPSNPVSYASLPTSLTDNPQLDLNVEATLFRWGNYDYVNNAALFNASDVPTAYGVPVPADYELPASLYYDQIPSWWGDDCAWPPIGPDVADMDAMSIPAQVRYFAGTGEEDAVTGIAVSPESATIVKGRSGQFTATVTTTGNAPKSHTWTITGATSADTVISAAGLLIIGLDETASKLTVTATSTFNAAMSASAAVTIVEPGDEDVTVTFADLPQGYELKGIYGGINWGDEDPRWEVDDPRYGIAGKTIVIMAGWTVTKEAEKLIKLPVNTVLRSFKIEGNDMGDSGTVWVTAPGSGNPDVQIDFTDKNPVNLVTNWDYASPEVVIKVLNNGAGGAESTQFGEFIYGRPSKVVPPEPEESIIPDERRMNWTPGVTVGVPGGITDRATMFVNVATTTNANYKCDPTGVMNCTAQLANALRDCPAGQYVYMPAGIYRVNSSVSVSNKSNITLRGDGMGKTVIRSFINTASFGSGPAVRLGSGDYPMPVSNIAVTGGLTKGSSVMTVEDASAIQVGKLMRIAPDNPPYVKMLNGLHNLSAGHSNKAYEKAMTFIVRVESKNGNEVTFTPPIPMDLSAYNPKVVSLNSYMEGVGIEDLTIDLDNANQFGYGLAMTNGWGCWVKDVEIRNSEGRQMWFDTFCAGEIRGCFTHGSKSGGPDHEGIDFYNDCCWNLIEDNITVNGGAPPIIIGDWKGGCQGNVMSYNYCKDTNSGSVVAGVDISFAHGPHNVLNLVEGNIANGVTADGYWGSSSHNTIFRNWLKAGLGTPVAYMWPKAIDITHFNPYYNVIGNVLGTPGFGGAYDVNEPYYAPTTTALYRLGYPNGGNASFVGTIGPEFPVDYSGLPFSLNENQERDLNVEATLFRWGNYDYANNAALFNASDVPADVPVPENEDIPDSLYLSGKPSWWLDECQWPAIGPDVNGLAGKIPAQVRFENMGELETAALSNFVLSAGELTPAFNPNLQKYDVQVASNVTSIDIEAIPMQTSAQVAVSGPEALEFGDNIYTITVTNGTSLRVYTLTVNRRPGTVDTIVIFDELEAFSALTGLYKGIDWGEAEFPWDDVNDPAWFVDYASAKGYTMMINMGDYDDAYKGTPLSKTITLPPGKMLKYIKLNLNGGASANCWIEFSAPDTDNETVRRRINRWMPGQDGVADVYYTDWESASPVVTITISSDSAGGPGGCDLVEFCYGDPPVPPDTIVIFDELEAFSALTGVYKGIDWGDAEFPWEDVNDPAWFVDYASAKGYTQMINMGDYDDAYKGTPLSKTITLPAGTVLKYVKLNLNGGASANCWIEYSAPGSGNETVRRRINRWTPGQDGVADFYLTEWEYASPVVTITINSDSAGGPGGCDLVEFCYGKALGVYKPPVIPDDATLALLTISVGTLTPDFDGGMYEYEAAVPYETDFVTIGAEAVKDTAVVAGTGMFGLDVGENVFDVTVADGSATLVYTITVTREEEVIPDEVTGITVTPASAIVLSGGSQQFTAVVTVTGNAATDVVWTVSGKSSAGTVISETGLLTLGTNESGTLTVTATSAFDPSKSAAATVTVTAPKLTNAVSTKNDFISIVETAKGSNVWALTFKVTETYSNGTVKVVTHTVRIKANNANIDGKIDLGEYTLIYDIKGNGSNIKDFRVILN